MNYDFFSERFFVNRLSIDFLSETIAKFKEKFIRERSKPKIHDYSKYTQGIDYFFEPAQGEAGWYLTSQGNVKAGDRFVLLEKGKLYYYQVQEIDYYSDRSNTFISRLIKLENF